MWISLEQMSNLLAVDLSAQFQRHLTRRRGCPACFKTLVLASALFFI
jgi:hypothetical protein